MIDLALERDLDRFFLQPIANEDQDHALELIKHPRTAVTFSDSGAHVSQIMDASLQTHLLAHWVRDKQALTLEQAVRMLSFDNATHWGFADRGLIREGFAADLVVFDPATVGPEMPEVAQRPPRGRTAPGSAVARHSRRPWSTARPCCATASTRARCRGVYSRGPLARV